MATHVVAAKKRGGAVPASGQPGGQPNLPKFTLKPSQHCCDDLKLPGEFFLVQHLIFLEDFLNHGIGKNINNRFGSYWNGIAMQGPPPRKKKQIQFQ